MLLSLSLLLSSANKQTSSNQTDKYNNRFHPITPNNTLVTLILTTEFRKEELKSELKFFQSPETHEKGVGRTGEREAVGTRCLESSVCVIRSRRDNGRALLRETPTLAHTRTSRSHVRDRSTLGFDGGSGSRTCTTTERRGAARGWRVVSGIEISGFGNSRGWLFYDQPYPRSD